MARAPAAPINPRVDGRGATFSWSGTGPPPVLVGAWCDWMPDRGLRLRRLGDGWSARLALPADAYVEYVLLRDGLAVPDPGNPQRIANGVGDRNNRFWMPEARRRAIALRRRQVPRGTVERGVVELGWLAAPPFTRRLDLYVPAATHVEPKAVANLPLLLVLDGVDYLNRGGLTRILDALIADGSMAPVAAAFLANAGPARSSEFAANDFTLAVLAEIVVPAAADRLGLAPQVVPGGRGRAAILGSSLGGLMAIHAGVRRPDVFGTVIAQSSSPMFRDLILPQVTLPGLPLTTIALIEATEPPPIRMWLDVGDLEGLAEPNDRLAAMLGRRGFDVTYRRFPGGHDQTSWAESLVDALPAMFPLNARAG